MLSQARGSLHVHAAIWVENPVEDAIVGTAPRAEHCHTRGEKLWRKFVLRVQRHDCRPKCFSGAPDTKDGEPPVCKYGYPRKRCSKTQELDPITKRYNYRCEKREDERLSPYIPLWLLATGATTARSNCPPAADIVCRRHHHRHLARDGWQARQ